MFGERECHPMSKKANPAALLPILVFLVLYLGLGLIFEYVLKIPMGFYSIPIVVIFLIALLVACCQNRALSFDEKLTLMGHGVGDKNIITMLLIFLAAGMFVGVVGRSSAESVAYFMLSIIPSKFAVAVLFVVSCFVSTAMGTSVGTITLITPIAIPIAAASGYSLPLCIGSVMGGAMFGDNLSFISDTTIAACNGQGCAMKDKFRENFHIAFPAALASLALILVLTLNADVHPAPIPAYNLIQIIPYVLVLIGGIIGINVFVVLLIGIVSGAVIALATGATGQTGILAVKALLENGLQPDILVLRAEHPLSTALKRKVALFCNVDANAVMESIDVPTIYEVPLKMHEQHLDEVVLDKLNLTADKEPDMAAWSAFVEKVKHPSKKIEIALVGKYTELPDAYKSICESFIHAGAVNDCKVKLRYVNSEKITRESAGAQLGKMSGILVAPGFGNRGIEGKIEAVRFARENNIPFLGICLGMQCAVIEFARHVLNLADANSSEMEQTPHPVIDLMEEQKGVTAKGGTMRLGAYPCALKKGSKVAAAYGKLNISERHRHRYEFNNDYLEQFEAAGMKAVGVNPDTNLVEVVEIENHPWFVGTQYHPEYKSTVLSPSPLFVAFVKAALAYAEKK